MKDNKFEMDFSYFKIVSDSERGDCGLKLTTEDTKSEDKWLAYWTADDFAECSDVDFEDSILFIIHDIINIAKEKAKTLGEGEVSWKRKCDMNGEKFLTTKSPRGRIKIKYHNWEGEPFFVRNNLFIENCGILRLRELLTNANIPHPSDDDFKWLKEDRL